jgi:hypothetical protein
MADYLSHWPDATIAKIWHFFSMVFHVLANVPLKDNALDKSIK